MELFADRFLVDDRKVAVDLATGNRIELTITAAGGETEQRRWAVACAEDQKLHHHSRPHLVDYGIVGESRRFEARAPGRDDAIGDAPAIVAIERPAVRAIGEVFEQPDRVRPRIAALWGPTGAGKSTAVLDLARMARLHGFVPVAARLLRAYTDPLCARSLFVIDDGGDREGWRALLHTAAGGCRPHVLLFVGVEEPYSLDGIGLTPLTQDALVRAVRPGASGKPDAEMLRRFAARAGGWPGRFARLLWNRAAHDRRPQQGARGAARQPDEYWTRTPRSRLLRGLRASETTVVYGEPCAAVPAAGGSPQEPEWVGAGEVASLRGRLEIGGRLIAEGRHAAGERQLRHAIGGLARRRAWTDAGQGGITLGSMLSRRGRVREAQAALKGAADYFRQAGDEVGLIDTAILSGSAALALGRTDEAETTLSTAASAARARDDRARTVAAVSGLAEALFWRGEYAAAAQALDGIEYTGLENGAIGALGLRSAIAVGTRHFERAVSGAVDALDRAQRAADPRLIAESASRVAFAHLAVGDLAAADRDATMSIAAARTSREPLVAARARLLRVEALRRSGRIGAAGRLLGNVTRRGGSILPPILRVHGDLCRDLLTRSGPADEAVARHVAATGLVALALFAPLSQPGPLGAGADTMAADLVGILDLCQTSDDELDVLTEVCRRIRSRLHGAATGIAVAAAGGCVMLTSDGGRIETTIADRAATAGIPIAPHRWDDRFEAAAPIRYGGAAIGAVATRWTIGTQHDVSAAAALLTTTAAAIAPIVSAVIARMSRTAAPILAGLLGSSAAMTEVRRGVERAAPAPFPVLIEGESGCGKEVVARAIHRVSSRRDRPFCTLNCAALPDDLVEAELFGHARGAFTGAIAERIGVFEEAHGGTLMLDEIGELSPRAQAKVLRVLQEGELRRVGENVSRRVDVRIVSATNRDLRREAGAGRFRLDLLYRLDVLRIVIPPLRDRPDDIAVLAEHCWREAAARVGSRATLGAGTLAALARYAWPGNVRELQNVLASLVVRSPKRGVVPPAALGPQFGDQRRTDACRLDAARRGFEERFVRSALVRTGGHRGRAAEELGVTRQGLAKLMSRLDIASD